MLFDLKLILEQMWSVVCFWFSFFPCSHCLFRAELLDFHRLKNISGSSLNEAISIAYDSRTSSLDALSLIFSASGTRTTLIALRHKREREGEWKRDKERRSEILQAKQRSVNEQSRRCKYKVERYNLICTLVSIQSKLTFRRWNGHEKGAHKIHSFYDHRR